MKYAIVLISLAATALLFWFCKSAPKHNADSLPAKQIRWGSGGGFTGKETSYALLENGQIFKFNGLDNSTSELKGAKAKTARGLFSSAESLELAKVDFNRPGNMSYFLEIRDDKGAAHKVVWGDDKMPVEQKVKDFYAVLQQLLQQ